MTCILLDLISRRMKGWQTHMRGSWLQRRTTPKHNECSFLSLSEVCPVMYFCLVTSCFILKTRLTFLAFKIMCYLWPNYLLCPPVSYYLVRSNSLSSLCCASVFVLMHLNLLTATGRVLIIEMNDSLIDKFNPQFRFFQLRVFSEWMFSLRLLLRFFSIVLYEPNEWLFIHSCFFPLYGTWCLSSPSRSDLW